MEFETNDLKRSLVAFAIEKVLLKMGKPDYELVVSRLRQYDCHLPDCFNHPEYLKRVLQDIYGNAYMAILENIEEELGEFVSQKEYAEFLTSLKN